jgi:hypothetical protein
MPGEIQLPDMIDPDARHAEFRAHQCRECGEAGPLTQAANPAWWVWGDRHTDETGHRKFFQYTITRDAGETVTLPGARRRRPLGRRD